MASDTTIFLDPLNGCPSWYIQSEFIKAPQKIFTDTTSTNITHATHMQRITRIFKEKIGIYYESCLKIYEAPTWQQHMDECIVAAGDVKRDPGAFTRRNIQRVSTILKVPLEFKIQCEPSCIRTAIVCVEQDSNPVAFFSKCTSKEAWTYVLAVVRQWWFSKRGSFEMWWSTHNINDYTNTFIYTQNVFRNNAKELTMLCLCSLDESLLDKVRYEPWFILPPPHIASAFGLQQQCCELFDNISELYTTHPNPVPFRNDKTIMNDILAQTIEYVPLQNINDEIDSISTLEKIKLPHSRFGGTDFATTRKL
jgi:hypothetical protein